MEYTKKILLIEDDKDIREILYTVLTEDNFEVKSLLPGYNQNLAREIDGFQPELIVLDYLLPIRNSAELCEQIKNTPSTMHLPVIVLSAYPGVLKAMANYGWDIFVEKPFDLWELLEIIKNCLPNHKPSGEQF